MIVFHLSYDPLSNSWAKCFISKQHNAKMKLNLGQIGNKHFISCYFASQFAHVSTLPTVWIGSFQDFWKAVIQGHTKGERA